jgi:hypothetical protein
MWGQTDTSTINGKIIDILSFEHLPFANVRILGSDRGVSTNSEGEFTIPAIGGRDELIVSHVGYQSKYIIVSKLDYNVVNIIGLQPTNINLQEITVYSNTAMKSVTVQSSKLSVNSERIREISVGMPDILRSMQAMPGVATNNEFKADFNVRGGNQDENLVLVNGTQVYEPFHIKEAPNASVGIFNLDLMKKVNLITGGFSARYGDKMSSVLNIDYREGSREEYSGAASISLAYFDGFAEGPIEEFGSFIIGARKSYLEYVLNMIEYEDISSSKPSFYDVQGLMSIDLSTRNKLLFEFIHAGDDFSYKPRRKYSNKIENEINLASYTTTLFGLKSKNILSGNALLNAEINYYDQKDNEYRKFIREYTNIELDVERFTFDTLKVKTLEVNSNIQYQVNTNYEIDAGLAYHNISYKRDADDKWTVNENESYPGDYGSDAVNTESFKYSAYIENIFTISNSFLLNIGGRLDYFDLNKELNLSPRINTSYTFNNGSSLKAAWGYYYQSPIYDQLRYSQASDTNTISQLAIHYILGYEHSFTIKGENNYLSLKIDGYYKVYDKLISSSHGVFERLIYSKNNDAVGNAKGIDLYAILNYEGFYTWLSYGLLYANEDMIEDNEGEYPRYTDQRHTLSIVSSFEIGNKWRFSIKGYYGSGFPYTPKTAIQNEQGIWIWRAGETNSANLPPYRRIDVRISKIYIFEKFKLLTFLDISNVLNFENVQLLEYSLEPDISKPSPKKILLWPILPTFGIRFEF